MTNVIEFGDCRETMRRWERDGIKAQMCVTSPPYFGLRDYGHDGQIGLEQTPEQYIAAMVDVFRRVRDVLADDGTLWVNIGDSWGSGKDYPGIKQKDLIGIPWMLAFALRSDGWYLRQDVIWSKPNPMPESVRDRCTKAHEYIFLLSKAEKYFFDAEAMREPAVQAGRVRNDKIGGNKGDDVHHSPGGQFIGSETRNRRSVWSVATRPYKGAHFATFPPALIEPCILAGSRPGDIVLDPFMGSGTTAQVALEHGRAYLGCELNPDYKTLQDERINKVSEKQEEHQLSLVLED